MPIYEYRCAQCGERFDRFVPTSTPSEPPPCPHCGAAETRKAFSTFAAPSAGGRSQAVDCAPGGG